MTRARRQGTTRARQREATQKPAAPPPPEPPAQPPPFEHKLVAPNYSLGSLDFGQPPGLNDREFEALLERGRAHFWEGHYSKPNTYPKHSALFEFYKSQRLSDGSPISDSIARHLATFNRPARKMRGGNSQG
jgi:hypothetical protein